MLAERTRGYRKYVFAVAATIVVAAVLVVAAFASGIANWAESTCNGTAAEVESNQRHLRGSLIVVWTVAAVAPTLVALVAFRLRRRAWPWSCIAGACLALAAYQGLTATSGTWCLY